jgi:hypothetical protein
VPQQDLGCADGPLPSGDDPLSIADRLLSANYIAFTKQHVRIVAPNIGRENSKLTGSIAGEDFHSLPEATEHQV